MKGSTTPPAQKVAHVAARCWNYSTTVSWIMQGHLASLVLDTRSSVHAGWGQCLDSQSGVSMREITPDPLRKSTASAYAVLKPNFPPEYTSLLSRWSKSCLFVIKH